MEISDHWLAYVHGSFALANAFGPVEAYGKSALRPQGVTPVTDALAAGMRDVPRLAEADARTLADAGRELWLILRAAAEGDTAGAAMRLNPLLAGASPRMVQHGPDSNWHLHFVAPDGDLGRLWSANLAVATGMFLGSADHERAKACQAPRCERVFLDATRNRSRQFCSVRCQDRVKAAAHRERVRAE